MMETIRLFTYLLTILSTTICWILAAVFLARTESALNVYYNGNVLALAAGAMSMLVLPLLMFLGAGKRRKDFAGVTIAECIIVFIFWGLFLSAASKFSSEYRDEFSWNNYCGFLTYCSLGRSALGWAWISFIMMTVLFVVTLIHGMFDYEGRQAKKDGLTPMDSNAPLGPNAANNGNAANVEKGGSTIPLAPPVPVVKD